MQRKMKIQRELSPDCTGVCGVRVAGAGSEVTTYNNLVLKYFLFWETDIKVNILHTFHIVHFGTQADRLLSSVCLYALNSHFSLKVFKLNSCYISTFFSQKIRSLYFKHSDFFAKYWFLKSAVGLNTKCHSNGVVDIKHCLFGSWQLIHLMRGVHLTKKGILIDAKIVACCVSTADICRVCRSEGTYDKPLYYPCVCTGSIKFIHQEW